MRTYSAYDYLSTEICFLLEIDIAGRTYRFSTYPVQFDEGGESVLYEGKLDNPDFSLSLEEVGKVKFSQSAISMAIFLPFDVSDMQLQGRGIDRSPARFYYVTVKRGEIQQSYDERISLFSGVVSSPIYGHPDMPSGYVEFSVENEIELSDQSLLRRVVGENAFLSATQFSQESYRTNAVAPPVDPDGITEVIRPHLGKSSPVVIGSPGSITDELGDSYGFPSTPAYQIAFQNSGSFPAWYVIAGHPVKASTVDIYDNQGNVDTNVPVYSQVGSKGQVYSFINLQASSPIDQSFVVNTDYEYWIRWDDGGGLLSPYDTGQALEGGGDLIVYLLDSSGITYDRQAMSSVRSLLNKYKFAGYINDPEIRCYDFLQRYIVSYLPIALVAGPSGLYPVIDHRLDDTINNPRVEITADETFRRIEPISPRRSEIINDLTVRFAPQGTASNAEDAYRGVAVIRAQRLEGVNAQYEIVSPYAIVSQQRYGRREQTISLDYVYDRETAIRIGMDYLIRRALPEKITTYRASFEWGYLDIGDIISLSDSEISLSQYRVMIIGKRYDGASWLYDILIQENPILQER